MFIDARTPNSDLRSRGARCSGNGLCVRVMFRSFGARRIPLAGTRSINITSLRDGRLVAGKLFGEA